MGIRMNIERLLQEGMAAGLRDPILDADHPFNIDLGFFPPGQNQRNWQRDRERVNQANAQRDIRDQSINWEQTLFRGQQDTDNLNDWISQRINQDQIIIEEQPAEPEANAGQNEQRESHRSQSLGDEEQKQDNPDSSQQLLSNFFGSMA